jgi:hypothetical protein
VKTVSQSCYHINRPSRGRRSVVRFSGRIGRVTNIVVQSYIFWCRFFRPVYDGSKRSHTAGGIYCCFYWEICVYIHANIPIEAAVNTTDSMAPFEPSYTALKNLHQKMYNRTTTSVTLPIRPENLTTGLRPYLDNVSNELVCRSAKKKRLYTWWMSHRHSDLTPTQQ